MTCLVCFTPYRWNSSEGASTSKLYIAIFLSGDVNLLMRAFIVYVAYVRPIVEYCSVVWSPKSEARYWPNWKSPASIYKKTPWTTDVFIQRAITLDPFATCWLRQLLLNTECWWVWFLLWFRCWKATYRCESSTQTDVAEFDENTCNCNVIRRV